jgi:hypothetical protein
MFAAGNSKWDIVELLLRRGANAKLVNNVMFSNFNMY